MKIYLTAGVLLSASTIACAAVSQAEAQKLGTTLTAFGAEKEASKDGAIPAYTGGLTKAPAGFKKGEGRYIDPYAGEKPLYTIDAKNVAQYADKLTEGSKALLKKYPTFRMEVYPSHRSIAYPADVLEATKGCATSAKLTTETGAGITGAFNCIPFPVPQSGQEAMWNHRMRYIGRKLTFNNWASYNVNSSGTAVISTVGNSDFNFPYYSLQEKDVYHRDHFFQLVKSEYTAPARRAGEILLLKDADDDAKVGRKSWVYLPGQRRVRLAPDLSYDTPNPATAGMTTFDDTGMFSGALDRFDWKLLGKKEMLIPYNNYRAVFGSDEKELLTPNHANPAAVRWELHRVWVVEGTLKTGNRHVYSKRRYYIDEDSWAISAGETYDARGQLWRVPLMLTTQSYDQTAPYTFSGLYHDLNASTYNMYFLMSRPKAGLAYPASYAADNFSPEAIAGSGVR